MTEATESDLNLKVYLRERLQLVETAMDRYLPAADASPAHLHEAMRYSVFAGGKRIRPILMMAACEAVGADPARVLPAACAIEYIHSYSLIHDDLPAMDDDDLRRGRPTNHKVYGEAVAILAGDALLTEAFVLLAHPDFARTLSADVRSEVTGIIASAAGSKGMVGGQVVDMESEGKPVDLETLEYIHACKTGALISAAIDCGAVIGGASAAERQWLKRYGQAAGLAFQVADDILDIVADQELLGKDVGSDQERGKATYPALLGLDGARAKARDLKQQALAALDDFGPAAQPLRAIAAYIVDRSF